MVTSWRNPFHRLRRLRDNLAVNPREVLEFVCNRAWPPLVDEPLGDWRLRWAGGFTGRANSALAVGDPGVPVPDALDAVCDFAHDRGIPAMVQVLRDSPNERAIEAAGWLEAFGHPASHEVVVLTGPLPAASPIPSPEIGDAHVADEPTPGWWELISGPGGPGDAERHVLTSGKIGYGVVVTDSVTVGAVRGSIVDGWLHVARLAVHPGFRRRGIASALMTALGAWGTEQGADQWVLQVAEGNTAALALYAGLGCTPHHRYRYWVPAPGTTPTGSCEDSTS
jgi:ribosomal protein S18 acetylase RimI-like enzyme